MNPTLRQRIDIFRTMPDIPPVAVDLVENELAGLDPAGELTDDQAGMFVSHAVNALARLVHGQPEAQPPNHAVYEEVLNEAPGAATRAQAMADRVREALGRNLPEAEQQFMTIHFAALQQHLGKEDQ